MHRLNSTHFLLLQSLCQAKAYSYGMDLAGDLRFCMVGIVLARGREAMGVGLILVSVALSYSHPTRLGIHF